MPFHHRAKFILVGDPGVEPGKLRSGRSACTSFANPQWSVELDSDQLDFSKCRFYRPVQPSNSAVYRRIDMLVGGAGFEPADDALLRRLIVFETTPIRPLRQPPTLDSGPEEKSRTFHPPLIRR